jgi:hypothetical protein
MKTYTAPRLVKAGKLSSVTAGANFSGKKGKVIDEM